MGIPAIRMALITIRDNLKSLDTLINQMEGLGDTKLIADKGRKSLLPKGEWNGKFVDVMKKFYSEAKTVYDSQDELFKQAEKDFERAAMMFGEDPKNTTPEEFFGIFTKFVQGYLTCKTENELAIAKEASEKKREEAKKVLQYLSRMKKKNESKRKKIANKYMTQLLKKMEVWMI